MHGYLSLEHDRNRIIALVAIGSYAASGWIHSTVPKIAATWTWLSHVPWLLPVFSWSILFGLAFFAMELYGWRLLSRFGLASPDFSGTWTGGTSYKYKGVKQQSFVEINIKQTWTKIQVESTTRRLRISSRLASISGQARELRFEYFAVDTDPGAGTPSYFGLEFLTLSRDKRQLTGGYYTQFVDTQHGMIKAFRKR